MLTQWKTVRVFISSTFRDMNAERDQLVKVVFPALRERLAPHRVELIDIDLRWGITQEQAENDEVLALCLQQVDACRPFFVGLLGERYGWIPGSIPNGVRADYAWVQHETGKSVTELEILFGGLLGGHSAPARCLFYLRDPHAVAAIADPAIREHYVEADPGRIALLDRLKGRIRASGYPVMEDYPTRWSPDALDPATGIAGRLVDLGTFGRRVQEQLLAAIRCELQLPDTPAPADPAGEHHRLAEEEDQQRRFVESRLRVYVGRESLQSELTAYADGDEPYPCLLTGPPGSGKSAALAQFVTAYKAQPPGVAVIPHFIGATPDSVSARKLLRRLCRLLKETFGFTDEVPEESGPLAVAFRAFLFRVPKRLRVVIVIDALDQFEGDDHAKELHWLPRELPGHVKILASCLVDPAAPQAEPGPVARAFRHRPHHPVRVPPLTDAERRGIIRAYPALFAKTLATSEVDLLLSNPATDSPLYLRVALEELRGFGSFDELQDRIRAFPREGQPDGALTRAGFLHEAVREARDPLTALFAQVIERLEKDFDPEVVRSVLVLLASARHGLSERELLDLLEGPGTPAEDSRTDLFPVLRQLRPYLLSRGGLLDFFHGHLLLAVERFYLRTPEARHAARLRLAGYFETQKSGRRRFDELPWQLHEAAAWERLVEVLADIPTLIALRGDERWRLDLHRYWTSLAGRYDPEDAYLKSLGAFCGSHPGELERATAMTSLGHFFGMLSARTQRASARMHRQAMDIRERVLGPEHLDTLDSATFLAVRLEGDPDTCTEAESLHLRVWRARERVLGPHHSATLKSLHNYAVAVRRRCDVVEAERLLRLAWNGFDRADGRHGWTTLSCGESVADLCETGGRHAEAEQILRGTLAGWEQTRGLEGYETLNCLHQLAVTVGNQQRHADAVSLLRRALAGQEKVLGNDHATTLRTVRSLAKALINLTNSQLWAGAGGPSIPGGGFSLPQRRQEINRLFERAITGCEREYGGASDTAIGVMTEFGDFLSAIRDYPSALAVYRRAFEAASSSRGMKDRTTLFCAINLGRALEHAGRSGESERLLAEALDCSIKLLGPGDSVTRDLKVSLDVVHNRHPFLHLIRRIKAFFRLR